MRKTLLCLATLLLAVSLWACAESRASQLAYRPSVTCPKAFTVHQTGKHDLAVGWKHKSSLDVDRAYWYLHNKPYDRHAYLDQSTDDPLKATLTVYPREDGTDRPANHFIEVRGYDERNLESACTFTVTYRPNRNPSITCTVPESDLVGRAQRVQCAFSDPDGHELTRVDWQLTSVPEGIAEERLATVLTWADANDRLTTTFNPPVGGEYAVRVIVEDPHGGKAYEDLILGAKTNTPPTVACPAAREVAAVEQFELTATADDPDKGDKIVSSTWKVVSKPEGSQMAPKPAAGLKTTLMGEFYGKYSVQFTATDSFGASSSCTTDITVKLVDDLVVQMWWGKGPDVEGKDKTDIDIHLLKPNGRWGNGDDHCHFSNCQADLTGQQGFQGRPTSRLKWYDNVDANPRLDVDDVDGDGREVISIKKPKPGTYQVLVNFYDPHNRNGKIGAKVNVKVFCKSTQVLSVAPGPVLYAEYGRRSRDQSGRGGKPGVTGEKFDLDPRKTEVWHVASVTMAADGSCTVAPIGTPECQRVCSKAQFWPRYGGRSVCPDDACRNPNQ